MMNRNIKKTTSMIIVIIMLTVMPAGNVHAKEIKIAVIDSGAKGYADSYKSFTTYSADEDALNHGTIIAKLIKKRSPRAKIYMLQVCERIDGILKPSREAVLKAIKWSVDQHMDVVNMSLVTHFDEEIEKAVKEAVINHGILFVAAAGNKTFASNFVADDDGFMRRRSDPVPLSFPASSPYVISVGSLDSRGKIASYSAGSSDVYAQGRLHRQKGTSFACARVTARIANILLEHNPTRNTPIILSYLLK
jgi:minor extracellular protease Epr